MSRGRAVLLAIVGAALVAGLLLAPVETWVGQAVDAARRAGTAGAVAYGVVYVLAALLLVPGSLLSLGAGLAWGPVGGFLVVWPAALTAALLAFTLGRTVLRGPVAHLARRPALAALDEALEREAFRVVLLLRLSPLLPFSALNYALGPSRVPLDRYAAATALGMIPGTLLYVYVGSTLTSVADLDRGRPDLGAAGRALYWGGLVLTAVATTLIARAARRALAARAASTGPPPLEDP